MAWPLTIKYTTTTELNRSKIMESGMQEKKPFQQHCNADDSFSGNKSTEAVVVIITCCLPSYPVTFFNFFFPPRSLHLFLLLILLLTPMCNF